MDGDDRRLKPIRGPALGLCASIGAALASSGTLLDPANFDPKAKPCDDFYQHATGGWTATHSTPSALSSWVRNPQCNIW
jgi:putative endopeptidase